jgi:hypothetical protein
MTRKRWTAVGGICAVAAAIVLGVALIPGDKSPGVALADAAGRIEGESMRMRLKMGFTDADGTYSVTGVGNMAADSSRGTMDMTFKMEGEPVPIRMRMLNIEDEFWFRYRTPEAAQMMPKGKPWVHMVDRTVAPSTLTPSEFAEFLSEADEVEEVGEARVMDQATTHYRGMIDVEKLGDEVGGETKERIQRAIESQNLPEGKKLGLPVEAWISEDGLPVRLRMWCGQGKDSFDMTMDVIDYGVPVEVQPPPRSKVIEEAEFDQLTAS